MKSFFYEKICKTMNHEISNRLYFQPNSDEKNQYDKEYSNLMKKYNIHRECSEYPIQFIIEIYNLERKKILQIKKSFSENENNSFTKKIANYLSQNDNYININDIYVLMPYYMEN